jgi:carbonic anhydrase
VHKSTVDNTLAVVGMFIDPKSAENNQEFDKILRGWEKYAEETASICNSTISNLTTIEEEGTSARHRQDRRLEAFNIYSLLAEGTGFYHYDGSLTTPPCSEIVWWSLADTNTKISVYQYNQLTSLVLEFMSRETCELATIASKSGTSSRPQQPLNGRIIKHICRESAKPTATADSPESSSASSAMTKATAFAAAAATSTAGILGAAAGLF